MAAMHSSQAYITYLSTAEERAKQLGRVSLSYGIGFVLGPVVGGTLSKYIPYNQISLIGMVGSALVCLLMMVALPDIQPASAVAAAASNSNSKDVASSGADGSKKPPAPAAGAAWWSTAGALLSIPSIRTVISVKFFLGTALALYRNSFSLVAKDVSQHKRTSAHMGTAQHKGQRGYSDASCGASSSLYLC